MDNPLVNARQINLPSFFEGQELSASQMQMLADCLRLIATGSGQNKQVVNAPTVPLIQQFVIRDEASDYLICNTWNGRTQGSQDFFVAKPFLLRQSTFDGTDDGTFSYAFTGVDAMTVTKTEDDTTEDWEVTMDYEIGDIIYGLAVIRGGIDIETSVDYIDLNTDGRGWAKV